MNAVKKPIESESFRPDPSRARLERSMAVGHRMTRRQQVLIFKTYRMICLAGAASAMIGWAFSSTAVLTVGIVTALMFFPAAVALWLLLDRVMSQRMDVSPKGIRIDRRQAPMDEYLYDEVDSILIQHVPFFYQKLSLKMKDGRELTLRPGWERLDYVYDLMALARPDLAKSPGYEGARNHAIVHSHSMSRTGEHLGRGWRVFVAFMLKSGGTAFLACGVVLAGLTPWAWSSPVAFLVLGLKALVLSMTLWIVWHAVLDTQLQRRKAQSLRNDPSDIRRNVLEETKWLVKSRRYAVLLALLGALGIGFAIGHEVSFAQVGMTDSSSNR